MVEFSLEWTATFSFGLGICGFRLRGTGKALVCKLKRGEAETLNDAWGTEMQCRDMRLRADGAQWGTVSSSWSKTHPGRLLGWGRLCPVVCTCLFFLIPFRCSHAFERLLFANLLLNFATTEPVLT